jgi:hypothetical protein
MGSLGVEAQPLNAKQLACLYMTAKERVIDAGFADEIDWQEDVVFNDLDEPTFLREAAWVVLSVGFRELIVRRRFGELSKAFFHWSSADLIMAERERCMADALLAFGHRRKINAILKIVERVADEGIGAIRRHIACRGIEFIRELPFMGPVTALHLAKNLGIVMVKPDRHLIRLAGKTGYETPESMCRAIAAIVGDSLSVIDIVIWRYSTITKDYEIDKCVFNEAVS